MRAGEGAARGTAAGSSSQLEEQRKKNKRGKNIFDQGQSSAFQP